MSRKLLLILSSSFCLFIFHGKVKAQYNLTSSPFVENFDQIESGLPEGFSVYSAGSPDALGTIATFNTAKNNWNNTAGAFKNFATATGKAATTGSADQAASTDRALGVRQTGSMGDPGAAFVFQVANTSNRSAFKLDFDLQSLDINSPRSVQWKVQYGIGTSPSTFADALSITDSASHTSMTTGGNQFFSDNIVVDFGNALDNIAEVVTIRIVTLSASTGSGNRPSTAIDNFRLSWSDIDNDAPSIRLADKEDHNISSLSFPSTSIGTPSVLSFTLTGKNLTDSVRLSFSKTGYKISSDSLDFENTLSLSPSEVNARKLFIKFDPTVAGKISDTLNLVSAGVPPVHLSLSGVAVDPNNTDFEFNTCGNNEQPTDGFTQYSVTGDYQSWVCTSYGLNNTNGINMNGYSSGNNDNDDWLISPKITRIFNQIPVLSFYSRGEFNGPSLQLLVSTDYDGAGNPENFTWTDLKATFPNLDNTWTLTDGINLTEYKGTPFYFAFRYISSQAEGAARWTLDSIRISDQASLFSVKPMLNNFRATAVGSYSAGAPVSLQSIGNGDIHIAAPASFEVSTDSASYATSIDIPAKDAEAGMVFYVRFAPKEEKLLVKDSLHITSASGVINNSVILSGSSIPKAATLNVAAYNMSFFASSGSSAIVRTNEQINEQINNIATVLEHMDADIIAFEEMSNDSGMNVLLSKVNAVAGKHYKAIISGFWSHKELADPTYPPQKIGFIYDSSRVTLSSNEAPRAMFGDSTQNGYGYSNNGGAYGSSFWASGRLPYMATFIANINGKRQKLRMVVIHAKAGGDADSYQRRLADLQVLHDSLNSAAYNADNIMILGDFNDRLSTSINIGSSSSYKAFVDDAQYQKLTYTLDTAGQTSFPGDDGMIDNMLFRPSPESALAMIPVPSATSGPSISWGMAAASDGIVYLDSSIAIEDPRQYIGDYNKIVGSDHLPIYARFDITTDDIALPITSIDNIVAMQSDTKVDVSWTTHSELDNQYFLIERAVDGTHFSEIGRVTGKGTTTNSHTYTFSDLSPVAGKDYYRIKQVGGNGDIYYSDVASVNFTPVSDITYKLYPNPVHNHLTIALSGTDDTRLSVVLVNIAHGVVLQAEGDLSEINRAINKKIPGLATGIYFIDLVSGNKHYKFKFLKR